MKLYNTLTRNIQEITPINPPTVTVYTCGPTVYDHAHIGHWFNYVRMDTLIRTLQASGLKTKWVMNITDVGHLVSDADEGEDKLEKGARREGKTAWEVAEFYTQDFMNGMKLLHIRTPDHIVKATEHITEQIELIQKLEEKGYTYVINDGVYFDTAKFPRYADFARLDLDEQQAGARVTLNAEKRNPTDFALWKFSPKGVQRDMEWDSPWSPPGDTENNRKGFPGWHIECSAMSMKYLGETLDVHTGGIDHIPVHHTNEIAQSEAATGKTFANLWLHSNHVMVNGEKISKSLGNGIRLQEILEQGISAEAVRLHILESHYRSQSKFSLDSLQAAQNRLKTFQAFAALQWNISKTNTPSFGSSQFDLGDVCAHMFNDMNTPLALASAQAQIDVLYGVAVKEKGGLPKANIQHIQDMLQSLDKMFGLELSSVGDIDESHKKTIAERQAARAAKDWSMSDTLRDQLKIQGIGLRDTEHGAIWYRI